MTTTSPQSFAFSLLRARVLDAEGAPLNEDGPDPAAWAASDAASDTQEPEWLVLGRGSLTATDADALAFARARVDADAEGGFIKARLSMDTSDAPSPRMGDLLAVHVGDGKAIVFEVVVEIDHSALDPAADWTIELAPGEVLLRHRADFGLMDTGSDEEEAHDARH